MSGDSLTLPSPLRVLLIEEDVASGSAIQGFLKQSGMRVTWTRAEADAIELKHAVVPDVVLIDPDPPGAGGVSLLNWLASQNDCGIIVVSGQAEEAAQVAGLELGADDYVAKPPPLRELAARIRAVHRRLTRTRATQTGATQTGAAQTGAAQTGAARDQGGIGSPAPAVTSRSIGPYRFDNQSRSVVGPGGEAVALTGAEFVILQMLLEASGQSVSRSLLSLAALRRPWRPEDRSVDQLVFQLRRKLVLADTGGRLIQAVRGAGYLLASLEPSGIR